MTNYRRKAWGAVAPTNNPTIKLRPSEVVGIALHWPGMGKPLDNVHDVMHELRGYQRFHMRDRRWSDIAYQAAVDQAGNVYELRGLKVRSAANGTTQLNRRYGAVLLLIAMDEEPTPAMVAGVRRVIARHRRIFPRSKAIVGHGEIRPGGTQCPGPAVRVMLDRGDFNPPPARRRVLGLPIGGAR